MRSTTEPSTSSLSACLHVIRDTIQRATNIYAQDIVRLITSYFRCRHEIWLEQLHKWSEFESRADYRPLRRVVHTMIRLMLANSSDVVRSGFPGLVDAEWRSLCVEFSSLIKHDFHVPDLNALSDEQRTEVWIVGMKLYHSTTENNEDIAALFRFMLIVQPEHLVT